MSTALDPKLKPPAQLPAFGGLTLKQSAFLDNFLTNPDTRGNGTKSVIAAGYTDNPATAAVIASQLLRSLKIKQELKRRLGTAIASGDEVLETLTRHARADLTDLLSPTGEFDFKKARSKRLLKKMKIKKRYEKDADGNLQPVVEQEFEIHDPQAALEKLGRFHKLFTDKLETELAATDIDHLAESIINGLFAAAQQRAQAQQLALEPAPTTSDSSEQP